MTNNMRLNELVAFIGIEPAGDILGDALVDVLAENGGFRWSGDGMEIDDSEVAFVLFEHLGPIAYGSQVVSKGKITGGLGAG